MKIAVCYVNPIEFHGTHLTLKNDYEISRGLTERFIRRLQEKNPKIEVSSVFDVPKGCDPAKGPGTEFTTLRELKSAVLQKCEEIEQTKPDFVLFMTFHGSPKHARGIQAGVKYFKRLGIPAYNPFNLVMKKVRDYDPSMVDGITKTMPDQEFAKKWQVRLQEDFHGGLFETSIMLALDPTKVDPKYKTQPDCPDRNFPFFFKAIIALTNAVGLKTFSRELHLVADTLTWVNQTPYYGYTSAPRFASAEIGEYFVSIFMEDYEKEFYEILRGKAISPKPVLQWTTVLSAPHAGETVARK